MSYGKMVLRLLLSVAEILLEYDKMLSSKQKVALQDVREAFAEDYRE